MLWIASQSGADANNGSYVGLVAFFVIVSMVGLALALRASVVDRITVARLLSRVGWTLIGVGVVSSVVVLAIGPQ